MNANQAKVSTPSRFRFSLRTFLFTVFVLAVLLGLFGYVFRTERQRAIDNAATLDQDAKPLHSWRINLAPFLQSNSQLTAYDFNDRWNGPKNIDIVKYKPIPWTDKLGRTHTSPMPALYPFCCPLERDWRNATATNCVAITGPGTCFPDGEARAFHNILDGSSHTIVFAEISNSNIHWLEPRDLRIDKMSLKINDSTKPSISSRHPTGPAVVFADAAVYRVDPSMPPETLKSLLTIAGHENVTRDKLIRQGLLH